MRFFFLLSILLLLFSSSIQAALATPAPAVVSETLSPSEFSREAVEAQLGRKLKFTERFALNIVRKKVRKKARKQAQKNPEGRKFDGLALGSMALGVSAFAALFFWVISFTGIFLGLLGAISAIGALVMGIVGLRRIKRDPERKGKGFAVAGIALGGAWFVLVLLGVTLLLLAFN